METGDKKTSQPGTMEPTADGQRVGARSAAGRAGRCAVGPASRARRAGGETVKAKHLAPEPHGTMPYLRDPLSPS